MPYISKIARLPKACRHELALRIEDGLSGREIVFWLNQRDDVQKALQTHFGGRSITEQNLSHWKLSGHLLWLRCQAAQEAAIHITEHADVVGTDFDTEHNRSLADSFAVVLTSEITRLAMQLLEKDEADLEKQWQRLCQIREQLSALRRDENRATRTTIQQERWDHQVRRQHEEDKKIQEKETRDRMIQAVFAPTEEHLMAEGFGGGTGGHLRAELLTCIKLGRPFDDVLGRIEALKSASKTPVKEEKSNDIASSPDKN